VYALNVIDGPGRRFVRAEAATVAEVFRNVLVISTADALGGSRNANFVIVASDAPLDRAAIADAVARVPAPAAVVEARGWSKGAMILRDNHAPVDQLLSS
jgi:hypothetical protein